MEATVTDRELVTGFRRGDAGMFTELVRRYEAPLYRFFRRYAVPAATADDLFQETFLRVYKGIGTYDEGREFRPWLYTVALNCLRRRIERATPPPRPLEAVESGSGAGGTSPDPGPADRAAAGELADRVRRAVESLPEGPREVFVLHHYQGLSYAEIAAAADRPLGTVKSQMHAALLDLRRVLGRYLEA